MQLYLYYNVPLSHPSPNNHTEKSLLCLGPITANSVPRLQAPDVNKKYLFPIMYDYVSLSKKQ